MQPNVKSPASPSTAGPGLIKRLRHFGEHCPLFLFTLPLFIVSHIENQYHRFIIYRFVYREITWLFVAPLGAWLLAWLLLRHKRKSFLYALILLLVFYFFADVKDALYDAAGRSFLSSYTFLLPALVVILAVAFWVTRKSRGEYTRLFLYTNILLLLFIASEWVGIAVNSSVTSDLGDRSKSLSNHYRPCPDCRKPDIFYIVFDEYSSSEVLRTDFGYNNPIDSFLVNKGFRVLSHSRSNYNLTPFSISSTFNLAYLPGLNTGKEFYMKEYLPGLPSVYRSEWIPILEQEGYRIVNHSIFNIENHPPSISPFDLWELSTLYGRYNIFRKIDYEIGWLIRSRLSLGYGARNYLADRNAHAASVFEQLMASIHRESVRPSFVYAHFMLPHGPYCYDSAGRLLPPLPHPITKLQDKAAYINQLAYTNTIIRKITGELLTARKRPLIVVLQGDHGYKQHDAARNQLEFGNLNAFYFSDRDYHMLSDSMTNVNTFRVIANTYFKQNFALLKDTSYFLQYK